MISIHANGIIKTTQQLQAINRRVDRAIMRAINKTLAKGKTLVSRQITQELNLKAGYIKPKIGIEKARKNYLSGNINASKKGLLLSRFAPRQLLRKSRRAGTGRAALSDARTRINAIPAGKKAAGISLKVKRQGRRKKNKKFFALKLNGGNIGIAIRTGRGRHAYKVLYGPSPSQVFERNKTKLEPQIQGDFVQTLQKQLQYELSR